MKAQIVVFMLLVACCCLVAGDALGNECANEFQKVTTCLTFATGKAETPSQECCKSVTELKNNNPICLCYIIEQIHNGSSPQIKSMGIQEARLLQLPTACKLINASTTECPKLLNMPPNSPDAAIFANSTAPTTPSTATPAAAEKSDGGSSAYKHLPQPAGPVAIAVAIFFTAFPTGLKLLMPSFST